MEGGVALSESTSESLLIRKSIQGNMAAFEELVSIYEKKVYTIAYRMMNNHEDASDVAQEAFIKIYQKLQSFKGESTFSTWLYRIVTNTCLDELRRRKTKVISINNPINSEYGEMEREIPDGGPTPEEIYESTEITATVQRALTRLPEEYRIAIVLKDIRGHSYEEISKILSCSLGTVKSRLSRGRNLLKEILVKEEQTFGKIRQIK